jgi:hypothetical protein
MKNVSQSINKLKHCNAFDGQQKNTSIIKLNQKAKKEAEKLRKELVLAVKDMNIDDVIGEFFRRMIVRPGHKMPSSEIEYVFEYLCLDKTFYHDMTRPSQNRWDVIFFKDDTYHYIKPEAIAFANTL